MEYLTHFKANWPELILGFIAGNTLWLVRQWLWQQWVRKSHRRIQDENRMEEEKTRTEVIRLRESMGHLSLAIMEQIEVDPIDKQEIMSVLNGEEIKG